MNAVVNNLPSSLAIGHELWGELSKIPMKMAILGRALHYHRTIAAESLLQP